ncbi:MAG: hypothetical protein HOD72_01895 [Opitutae bacterium]|nr:hypothetical protein [Opitutae bacterium]MBT6462928.1 hypothetical protein [Opitutae bacterium]MBT7854226.1 hypothetical protein [Opitutae bacterium]
MKISIVFTVTLMLAKTLLAEQGNNIQQLHDEIHALKQRVAALELRLAKQQIKLIETVSHADPGRPINSTIPNAPQKKGGILGNIKSSRNNLMEDLRNGFHSTNKPAEGKWTNSSNWIKIQKGMQRQQVEGFLGKAAAVKKSIKLKVDDYWLYIGKVPNGDTLQGRVRFYKGKVTSWEAPKF